MTTKRIFAIIGIIIGAVVAAGAGFLWLLTEILIF